MLSPFLFFSKAGDINSLNLLVYLFIFFLSNFTNNQQIPYSAIANFDKNQPRPVAMKLATVANFMATGLGWFFGVHSIFPELHGTGNKVTCLCITKLVTPRGPRSAIGRAPDS